MRSAGWRGAKRDSAPGRCTLSGARRQRGVGLRERCRSESIPVRRRPPTSALPWDQGKTASAEGPALRRAARRCRAPASFASLRVPLGPVTVIPRAPAAALSAWAMRLFFRQNAAGFAIRKERGWETDPLRLWVRGKQCSEIELVLPLLFSSFSWHVGCLLGCAELAGLRERRSFERSGLPHPAANTWPPPRGSGPVQNWRRQSGFTM